MAKEEYLKKDSPDKVLFSFNKVIERNGDYASLIDEALQDGTLSKQYKQYLQHYIL